MGGEARQLIEHFRAAQAEMSAGALVVTLTIQGLESTQRTTNAEGIQFKSRHRDFPGTQGTQI